MFLYQQTLRYFATVADGLEPLAAEELVELGAGQAKATHRGVHFVGDPDVLYRITYEARLTQRVLAPLESFACHSARYLRRRAQALPWEEFLELDRTLAVDATVSNSRIRHSQYAALCVKDGIVDRFRQRLGRRPNVDRREPWLRVNVHVQGNKAALAVDCSGGSMHRRGYRRFGGKAPLQETLAAAIVRLSGWDGEGELVDPMCGSGTLLAEALMRGARIPSGFLREHFGLECLPDFDEARWQRVRVAADARIRPLPGKLSGSDVDPEMIAHARANLSRLPQGGDVELQTADFRALPGCPGAIVLCNPPYGRRLGDRKEVQELLRALGDFLKQRCPHGTAWIYVGDRELAKSIGLRASMRKPLRNGGLDGRLLRYDLIPRRNPKVNCPAPRNVNGRPG